MESDNLLYATGLEILVDLHYFKHVAIDILDLISY